MRMSKAIDEMDERCMAQVRKEYPRTFRVILNPEKFILWTHFHLQEIGEYGAVTLYGENDAEVPRA